MTNFNKEALVAEFIFNTNILNNKKYIDLVLYKNKSNDMKKEVKYFIETYLYDSNYTGEFNYTSIEDLIIDIEEFDLHEIVDGKVDIYYENLMISYKTFDDWLDINEKNDLSIIETIQFAQYEAYNELYQEIRSNFIDFLRNKLK